MDPSVSLGMPWGALSKAGHLKNRMLIIKNHTENGGVTLPGLSSCRNTHPLWMYFEIQGGVPYIHTHVSVLLPEVWHGGCPPVPPGSKNRGCSIQADPAHPDCRSTPLMGICQLHLGPWLSLWVAKLIHSKAFSWSTFQPSSGAVPCPELSWVSPG